MLSAIAARKARLAQNQASKSESSDASQDTLSKGESSTTPSRPNPSRKRKWSPSAPLQDSSDEDLEIDDADEPMSVSEAQPELSISLQRPSYEASARLSTFQPVSDRNVFHLGTSEPSTSKRTVLLLSNSDTVALLGTYSITVARGTVSLGGVLLNASTLSYPVFAPRSSPIPIIHGHSSKAPSEASSLATLPSHVTAAAKEFDSTIIIEELFTGIEGLGRICRTFDGFFTPSRWQSTFDMGLSTVYFLRQQTSDVAPLRIPQSWDAALEKVIPISDQEVNEKRVILVKGAKNTGKSTFARLMLNRLLSRYRRVAYLECDLGQSEFTPGGMVSLNVLEQPFFGPPFSHPSIPYSAHYIGATSPRATPSHYLDAIHALMQTFNLEMPDLFADESEFKDGRLNYAIPLVVNTMGWTKGQGADIAQKIEGIVEPSHIFSFNGSPDEDWEFADAPPSHGGPHLQSVEPIQRPPTPTHYTATDYRNLSVMSYFHAEFPNTPSPSLVASSWRSALPLCAQQPYEVDPRVAFDQLFLTGAGTEDVTSYNVHRALNCSVVGLVSSDISMDADASIDAEEDGRVVPYYEQGATPPSPHTSKCLGLALVRAISPSPSPRIHLVTPVPPHLLGSTRVLVMGELQLPIWGMLDYRTLDDGGDIAGYERDKVPYLRWGKGDGVGGERRRVRRNLMRRNQM